MDCAPIALFVYNRPEHTRRTIHSLQNNEEQKNSDLFIFSDGPKDEASSVEVDLVRKYINTISGFKSVTIIARETNYGLARSIIDGVTNICNEYGRVIVMEDDLIVSPFFLRYMNDGLDKYESDSRIISIHGYMYPIQYHCPETYFLKGADCWGWATWKRGWDLFEKDGRKLLSDLKSRRLIKRFDYYGAYRFSNMLKKQISGRNDSWAVRWYASALLHDKLTLYPCKSLVINIGFDGSGTHCSEYEVYNTSLYLKRINLEDIEVCENHEVFISVKEYFEKGVSGVWGTLFDKLKNTFRD